MQTHHQDALLTVPAFASALNVTPACVRRWVLVRKVDWIKCGRLVRIPESEVRRIISEGFRPRLEGGSQGRD